MTLKEAGTKATINLTNWKTTAMGIILAGITILSALGVFTPEQATGVQTEGINIVEAVDVIIKAVSAIILMFAAKDGV